MAECSGSQLTVDWFGLRTDVVNLTDWTSDNDGTDLVYMSDSTGEWEMDTPSDLASQKRSNIVHAIIHNRSLKHLRDILESGWGVDELLWIPDHRTRTYRQRQAVLHKHYRKLTALGEAARQGWTEGVKLLLDAGADCSICKRETPLGVALDSAQCPTTLIELLLQHGADPNQHHDPCVPKLLAGYVHPLEKAMRNCMHNQNVETVQLLLRHGADPNVGTEYILIETYIRDQQISELCSALMQILMTYVVDINYTGPDQLPLLHRMTSSEGFLQEQLELFFLHGGNINMNGGRCGTALEHAVIQCEHSNIIRWLIRHGADTSLLIAFVKGCFMLKSHHVSRHFNETEPETETPLILLQAGMRVSHGAVRQLRNMQTAISDWMQDNNINRININKEVEAMWAQLEEAEKQQLQRRQCLFKKSMFPQCLTQQMADLQEFSDENLNVYPEVPVIMFRDARQKWQSDLDQIQTMLGFLSQVQSLQWYCRRCVRENLVSLQPSVVKVLPIPMILKRYILCHEI